MPYFTDDEILKKTQFLALVCIGGLAEGYDYSAERKKLDWWGKKRRQFGYAGGFISQAELEEEATE